MVENSNRARRQYLENLGRFLVLPLINQRNLAASLTNYRSLSLNILESLRRVGMQIARHVLVENNTNNNTNSIILFNNEIIEF